MNNSRSAGDIPGSDLDTYRYLFRVLWQHRKTLLRIVIAVTALMLIYVLIMPQTYTSTVTLLPPKQESKGLGLGSLLEGAGALPMLDLGNSLGLGNSPSEIFSEILKSQSVAESLIVREHLDDFFGIPEDQSYRFAIEPLAEATEIEVKKNGVLRLSLTLGTGFFAGSDEVDSVKAFTAHVANEYVYWLDRINQEKLISSARNSRMFIESEIGRTQDDLDSAYTRLVRFQKEHKSVFLEKQMEAALTGAADIKEKLMQAQAEMSVKKKDFSESSRLIKQLEAEIDGFQRQYAAMSTGKDGGDADFYVPFQQLPEVAREMAGHLRKVKVLEQVILFLSQQYYQDRVQEARDTPTVQVLDEAVPAIQRTSPRRALYMIMTVFFSLVFASLFVMLRAFFDQRSQLAANRPAAPPGAEGRDSGI